MANVEQIAEELDKLTLLEAAQLSKLLQEKWGVSAAAPMAVAAMPGLGLKEAKDLVDGAPKPVKEKVTKAEADDMRKKLEEQGATVQVK